MTYPKQRTFRGTEDAPQASARGTAGEAASTGVSPAPRFPWIEEAVLDYWKQDGTFQASIDERDGADEWVFNDGPPFANGLPHYGHLLTGYAKDVFPRFQTMRGKKVERRFGWDTHGLPAELEAMKQLGITEKSEILEMGIDTFNAKARESVLQYTREWEDYVTRQARWVDFENDYKTLNIEYMESVIWAFAELYKKGLAYEGQRILPYCWRDETPLSNHELRMDDDVYQMRQDPSVTVTFPLYGTKASELGIDGVRALAWTTTPWTLPTNFSVAVGPEVRYAVLPAGPNGAADGGGAGDARYLLAADRVAAHAKELGYDEAGDAAAAVTHTFAGAELEYVTYQPLWDTFADAETWGTEHAWIFTVADYVTTDDGTGVVHQATAYGEEDMAVNARYGIPVILSVDDAAEFLPLFKGGPLHDIAGVQAFEANRTIINVLKADKRLLREASYEHSYPHCWRCRAPLMYKAVSSWFVRVTELKDRLKETNEAINWVPENVKYGQFGKWLEGARDWSISRNRFWGTPIPVWVSDDPEYPCVEVFGSVAELEAGFGTLPRNEAGEVDLHRPYIDQLVKPNPNDPTGNSHLRRIEDVLDVWFDSGSMPFAQAHYPFENQEWFDTHQPADFIVEYIGQTRGWFYVQHVLSTALFDRPAFTNVISHGIVLGSDGNKMSKSLRNYPDVSEVFERDGSDAMRWFLMASPVVRGGNLIVTEEGIREGVRQFTLPLWNSWYFFTLYANADGIDATWRTDASDPLDRYILTKTGQLIRDVETSLDALDTTTAAAQLRDFAATLTNWYVRRSRDRFWEGTTGEYGKPENRAAFDTLFTVLETLCRVAAPMAPLVTEEIWRGLTGGRSVHLTDWPNADDFPDDTDLAASMDEVRAVTSQALSLRKAKKIRVRQPLARLTVVTQRPEGIEPFTEILREELNVKAVELIHQREDSAAEFGIVHTLTVHARVAGPRLGRDVQTVIRASKSGDWSLDGDTVTAGGITLEPAEYELTLQVESGDADDAPALALIEGGGFVLLNTELTPELEAEGIARDAIRAVQDARKQAGLDITDRITLGLAAAPDYSAALHTHRELIAGETLATSIHVETTEAFDRGSDGAAAVSVTEVLGTAKAPVRVSITRAGAEQE